jgi:hypothetical protein
MKSRRSFIAASVLLLPLASQAQQTGAGFVGEWQGDVPGIGGARLIITGVRQTGQIDGKMEFALQSFVSTFGDKADTGKNTNYGMVSGSTLNIDAALGGKYALQRTGDQLTGTYTRGTTYNVAVSFKKA